MMNRFRKILSAALVGCMAVSAPVSYTHLDVYKRQRHCCAGRYGLRRADEGAAGGFGYEKIDIK